VKIYNYEYVIEWTPMMDVEELWYNFFKDLTAELGLRWLKKCIVHRFQPQGLTFVGLIAESHVAVHTWPEHGQAYLLLSSRKRVKDPLPFITTYFRVQSSRSTPE